MAKSRRPIFRESAMKQYLQKREQDILPHTVSPPFFTYAWLVLLLLIVAGILAWSSQVPTFTTASGVITGQGGTQPSNDATRALLFVPSSQASQLKAGEAVQLQVGANGQTQVSKITSIEPGVISPADARKRFALDNGEAQVITQPSVVAIVELDKSFPAHTFAGTTVSAQVQTGSHSVISEFSL